MSKMMYINACFIRCRYRYCYWLLMHIWFNKCVILLNRWNPWLCWTHEWVQNHIEPIHVIWWTLARHYTNFSYRCNVVTELHPSIIHFFNRDQRRSRMWRNSLVVSKLSYNPLRSMNDRQGPPSEMVGKQGDDIKFSKWTVVTICNPTHNIKGQSVQMPTIHRHG